MNKKSNAKKAKQEEPKKTVLEAPEEPKMPAGVSEPQMPKMRKIVIETNGNDIRISHDETAGRLELLAILQALMGSLTSLK